MGETPPNRWVTSVFQGTAGRMAGTMEEMAGDPRTLPALTAPTVLLIGCSDAIARSCAAALANLGTLLKRCEIAQAANHVAECRPLVMVMPPEVYEFDPRELDALARDVGASLLRVEDDVPEPMLEMLLGAAVDAAVERRTKLGLAMIGLDDPPPSRRKTAARRRSWMDLEVAPPSSQP